MVINVPLFYALITLVSAPVIGSFSTQNIAGDPMKKDRSGAPASGREKREPERRFRIGNVVVDSMAISPTEESLVCTSHGGRLHIFDTGTGKQRHLVIAKQEEPAFRNIVFNEKQDLFACHRLNALELWDARTGKMAKKIDGAIEYLLRPFDGKLLVGLDPMDDDLLTLWDWNGKKKMTIRLNRPLEQGQIDPYLLTFSPDGRTLASCGVLSPLETFDTTTGRLIRRFTGKDQRFTCVAFSPDGQTIATSDDKGLVRLWDHEKGTLKHRLQAGAKRIEQIRFSPDGKILASCGQEHVIRRFDPTTGKQLAEINTGENLYCLAFTPDSKRLFSAGGDIREWDMKTGGEIGAQSKGQK